MVPEGHVGRVAVTGRERGARSQQAVVEEWAGAVGGGLGRAAGAAVVRLEVGRAEGPVVGELRGRRDRIEVAGRETGEEVERGGLDADEVAVGVINGGDVAEPAERGQQVGGVGTEELEGRLGIDHRLDGRLDRGVGGLAERHQLRCGIGEVVVLALLVDGEPEVLEDGDALGDDGVQLAEEAGEVLRRGPGSLDQWIKVVEGWAEVREGRICLAEGRRQRLQGPAEVLVLGGDRAERLVAVGGQLGEVVAALAECRHDPRAADEEVAEDALVGVQLVDQTGGRGE